MKKTYLAAADFETTYVTKDEYLRENKSPEVYSWAIYHGNEEYEYGIDINTFIDTILNIKRDTVMFFHNGAKYDLHYLIPALEKRGLYPHVKWDKNWKTISQFEDDNIINYFTKKIGIDQNLSREDKMYIFDIALKNPSTIKKLNTRDENTFDMMVDGNYHILQIVLKSKYKKVTYKNKKPRKTSYSIYIKDSIKNFPASLKKLGESLNKTFNTDKYSKGSISYMKKDKYKSIEELENDDNELEYLIQDTRILWKFIDTITKFETEEGEKILKLTNLGVTSGSTSYKMWKYNFLGKKLVEISGATNIETSRFWRYQGKKYTSGKLKDMLIERILPKLKSYTKDGEEIEITKQLYKWYEGGLTFSNPTHRGVLIKDVSFIDINSSYPSSMYYDMLPAGKVEEYNKYIPGEFIFYEVKMNSDVVNEKGLPFIQVLDSTVLRSPYAKTIPKGYKIYLTTYNIDRFQKYYSGDYTITPIYQCETISANDLFGDFIDFWMKIKVQSEKNGNSVMRLVAKWQLASLYGKFGTKRLRDSRLRLGGKWYKTETLTEQEYYLPIAIAITNKARMKLVDVVGFNYDKIIGGDTDSIAVYDKFIPYMEKMAKFHETELGAWKTEMRGGKGIFRRSKQYYFEMPDGSIKMAFAGVQSDRYTFTLKDMIIGRLLTKEISPLKTPTGILLYDDEKEIKPVYDKDYIKWDRSLNLWYKDEDSYYKNLKSQSEKVKKIKESEWLF